MRRYLFVLIATALLAPPSLARAQDVNKDFDHAYDFSTIKTFSVKIGQSWGNPLGEGRVTNEIAEALAAKGWKLAPEGSADAVVVLNGATDTKHNVTTFYDGYGWGGWGYSGFGTSSTMVSEYRVGTLVTDIFDAKTKKLVFRATATDELSDKAEKNAKKAEKAAEKMFKDFPPKPKK
jgi:hypothetical protein